RTVHKAIEQVQLLQPSLKLLGHLVIRSDNRLIVHRTYEQQLRRLYEASIFSTVIPEASAFKVSLSCRQPVSCYAPHSQAAAFVATLGNQLLHRIADV